MTKEELKVVLDKHEKWTKDEEGGERANLRGADLRGANLRVTNLSVTNLSGADLSEANLSGANLSVANLSRADLSGADLSVTNLSVTNLSGADLSEANFSGAYLREADLICADLRGANLSSANLSRADLSGADLSGANLSSAHLGGADLRGANLSGALGLLSAYEYMDKNFVCDDKGYIVYRAQKGNKKHPDHWVFEHGNFLTEVPNPDRCTVCGCGVSFATLNFVKNNHKSPYWRCRINWKDLLDTVIPYNTDGKGRCARLELLEIVEE